MESVCHQHKYNTHISHHFSKNTFSKKYSVDITTLSLWISTIQFLFGDRMIVVRLVLWPNQDTYHGNCFACVIKKCRKFSMFLVDQTTLLSRQLREKYSFAVTITLDSLVSVKRIYHISNIFQPRLFFQIVPRRFSKLPVEIIIRAS